MNGIRFVFFVMGFWALLNALGLLPEMFTFDWWVAIVGAGVMFSALIVVRWSRRPSGGDSDV